MGRKRIQPTAEEIEQIGINPFVNETFTIQVQKRTDKSTFKRDKDGLLIPKEYDQEIQESTRVYKSPDARLRVALLSSASRALLLWIMYELEPAQDYVVINRQRYMAEHQLKTDKAIKEAMFDLARYQFITPTILQDVYWINPRLLFSGSRIQKYPKNIEYK